VDHTPSAIEKAGAITLGQTQKYILDKDGHILIALLDEEPVGTCALMRIDGKTVEPAKMSMILVILATQMLLNGIREFARSL